MGWKSKYDIVPFLVWPILVILVGVIAPVIVNLKAGNPWGFVVIVVLAVLIGCAIYVVKSRNHKGGKQE